MAVICDMAKGSLADRRYFLEIVQDWIKTDFMRKKVASCYIQMVFIVCCFLLTAPTKKRSSVSGMLPMVSSECVSRYRDLFTTETKEFSFFRLRGR